MNRVVSIAVRCCMICVAAAPLYAQTMGRTPANAASADSQHTAMMSDSSKRPSGKKAKAHTAGDSGTAMKKSTAGGIGMKKGMASDSGMAMKKPMANDSGIAMRKPMAKDSGMMKKPQR